MPKLVRCVIAMTRTASSTPPSARSISTIRNSGEPGVAARRPAQGQAGQCQGSVHQEGELVDHHGRRSDRRPGFAGSHQRLIAKNSSAAGRRPGVGRGLEAQASIQDRRCRQRLKTGLRRWCQPRKIPLSWLSPQMGLFVRRALRDAGRPAITRSKCQWH